MNFLHSITLFHAPRCKFFYIFFVYNCQLCLLYTHARFLNNFSLLSHLHTCTTVGISLKNCIVRTSVLLYTVQCCGSGMFNPGSGSDHCSIPDPDPGSGGKKHRIPDPESGIEASRIRGVKKHRILVPDPQH
jgi:hypothetical protein